MSGKNFIQEFKEFALRGNVIDLAVGVIIGGAFNKIVTSIVNDILMPPIGKMVGGTNFADLYFSLDPGKTTDAAGNRLPLARAQEAGAAVIAYGQFINVVLNFLLVAFCIFLLVKGINMLRRKQEKVEKEDEQKAMKECPFCLTEIPLQAVRCSHCTSMLAEVDSKA